MPIKHCEKGACNLVGKIVFHVFDEMQDRSRSFALHLTAAMILHNSVSILALMIGSFTDKILYLDLHS